MIIWEPAALTPRGIVAITTGITGSHTFKWGDGKSSPATGAALHHTYAAPGDYALIIEDDAGTVLEQAQVRIRDGLAPNVTFAAADDNPNIIEAHFTDDPPSEYEITWVAGDVDTFWAPQGTVKPHGYRAGDYSPMVRDLNTRRALVTEITVTDREYDPDATITQGADDHTALLTLTRVVTRGKPVLIDWGHDGKRSTIDDGQVDATATHVYPTLAEPKSYLVQVVYSDASTEGVARPVKIPFPVAP